MGPDQPVKSKRTETEPKPAAQPEPKKKGLSKGAIWGIVLGSVGLVLVIVGVILALVFLGPPSKADYEKAYDKVSRMKDTYSDMDIEDDLEDAKSIEDIDKIVDNVKKIYDKDINELGGMKAMNDQDVKKAFEEYKKRYNDAMPHLRDYLKTTFAVKDISSKCGYKIFTINYSDKDKSTAQKNFDNKSKDCVKILDSLESTNDENVQKFAKKFKEYVSKFRTYVGDYADARGKNDYAAMSKLKYPSSSEKPSVYDLRNNLSDDLEEYDITDSFNELQKLLKNKI